MIKGFFFDLDGTLVNTYKADFLAYRDAIKEVLNVVITETAFNATHGQQMVQKLKTLAPHTTGPQAAMIASRKKHYYPAYLKHTVLNDDLTHFIKCFSVGYTIALVTTAKRDNAQAVLRHHNIDGLFSLCIYGDDVTVHKPHPSAYLQALEKTGLKPSEAIAFEDNQVGAEAAEAAGVSVIMVRKFAA